MDIKRRRRNAETSEVSKNPSEIKKEADFSSASEVERSATQTDTVESKTTAGNEMERTAQERMNDYMSARNYSPQDSATYKSDPEWQALNRDLIRNRDAADPRMEKIDAYFEAKGFSPNDYDLYKNDPEWQALDKELVDVRDSKEVPENEMNPFNFTDADRARIREGIRTGEIGEKEIRDIGSHMRERSEQIVRERYEAIAKIEEERAEYVRQQIFAENVEEIEAIRVNLRELRRRENLIIDSLAPSEVTKKVVGETRLVGPGDNDPGQSYVNESDYSVRTVIRTLNGCRENLPTEWLEKSNDQQILAKHVNRGYFIREGDITTIALSPGRGMERCAYHELGHHFEELHPEIRKLEHEFYNRRTEGESLKWLGFPYKLEEKTRRDDFTNPYMGKDYGNTEDSGYEILSMGMEGLYTGTHNLREDPDYQDFIYGILGSV